jgi:flagellar motor switch protein FliM
MIDTSPKEHTVEVYDFRHAEHMSKRQLRACTVVHDRVAAHLADALSGYLETTVEVTLGLSTQSSYTDFVAGGSSPTCYSALSLKPLDGSAALETPLELLFPIIERLLGGRGEPVQGSRPMTEIEGRIVQNLLRVLAENLKQGWAPACPIEFSLSGTESNPELLQITTPNDQVMSVEFQVRLNDVIQNIRLALPMTSIDPVLQSFDKEPGSRKKAIHDDALLTRLRRIPVGIHIETPETMFPIKSLVSVQPGDTLLLNQRDDSPVLLKVVGKTKLMAQPRKEANAKAFTIIAHDTAAMEEQK